MMWTLIVIGLAFFGWYFIAPQGEDAAGSDAASAEPAPPSPPSADAGTDGSEFQSPGS